MQFGCCGANGPSDWSSSKFNAKSTALNVEVSSPPRFFSIPASCCKPDIPVLLCDKARKIEVGVTRVPDSNELYSKVCAYTRCIRLGALIMNSIEYFNSILHTFPFPGLHGYLGRSCQWKLDHSHFSHCCYRCRRTICVNHINLFVL